jgi:Ca2+-binding EF-hand superfamily protein
MSAKETTMRAARLSLFLASTTLMLASGARAAEQAKPYDPRAAFVETDTNKDGAIDLEEFHVRLVEIFYNADTNKDGFLIVDEYERLPFSGAFKEADANGDGRVSLPEFVRIRFQQFEAADTNHDGELSLDEVVVSYEGRKPK